MNDYYTEQDTAYRLKREIDRLEAENKRLTDENKDIAKWAKSLNGLVGGAASVCVDDSEVIAQLRTELAKRDALLSDFRSEAQRNASYDYRTDNRWMVKRIDELLGEQQ